MRRLLLPLLIVLLAAGLRFYRIEVQSFWNDEGNSARLSERSIPLIIEGTASDVHPPFYYLLLHAWRIPVGDTELALRAFSAFAGVLTTAVVFKMGQGMLGRTAGGLAALGTAVSPPLVYYSQEARMYSLLALWSILAAWALAAWMKRQEPEAAGPGRRRVAGLALIAYALTGALGWWTHYSFPAILAAHSIGAAAWLVLRSRRIGLRRVAEIGIAWGAALLLIFLLYLPWLAIFLQASGRAGAGRGGLPFLATAGRWIIGGPILDLPTWQIGVPIFLAALGAVFLLISPDGRPAGVLLTAWLVVPPLLMLAVGATTENYLKFLTAVVPAFWLLAAAGARELARLVAAFRPQMTRPQAALAALFLLMTTLPGSLQALGRLYFDPATFRADYRRLAAEIAAAAGPEAAILLNAPNQWEVFTYYYDGPAAVYPFPRNVMDESAQIAELERIAASHRRIYGIFWGSEGFDPQRVTERWLDGRGYKAIDEFRGDLRFVLYALPAEPASGMETPLAADFGESGIRLEGYTLGPGGYRPGDVLQVSLFWQAVRPVDRRYKVFLHLLDAEGELVTQRDTEPAGNLRPTDGWQPGETIQDNHGLLLPLDLPAGRYRLVAGLYDLADPGDRLPVVQEGEISDRLRLGLIEVVP